MQRPRLSMPRKISTANASLVVAALASGGCSAPLDDEPAGAVQQTVTVQGGLARFGWRIEGNRPDARIGKRVQGVGDVNGDGFDDVAVGSRYDAHPFDPLGQDYGKVDFYFGSPTGLRGQPSQTITGRQRNHRQSVPIPVGDVNGDGYADVMLEAEIKDELTLGPALHLGGPTGLTPNPVVVLDSSQFVPTILGNAGDLTGDARSDVLVWVADYYARPRPRFELRVYPGTLDGVSTEPIWSFDYDPVFGVGASGPGSGMGDFNGDGFFDVMLGDPSCDDANGNKLVGFWGTGAGLSEQPSWTGLRTTPGDCRSMGRDISSAGDVNGDGFADVLASSGSAAGWDFDGTVDAFYGGAAPNTVPAWGHVLVGYRGWNDVSGVGDADGDGYNDALLGLEYHRNNHPGRSPDSDPVGQARVYRGSTQGLGATPSWRAYDEDSWGNSFALMAASAGDVNGDGFADIIVGDEFAEDFRNIQEQTREGMAWVFYGSGGPEPSNRVLWGIRALHEGTEEEIPEGGVASKPHAFDIAATGLGTEGRTRAKLEVEVRPSSEPFDGSNLLQSPEWLDTGVGGADFRVAVPGLPSATPLHFRVRLVYRPDVPSRTRHTRWFGGSLVVTACAASDPDHDADGTCDARDDDDDDDGWPDSVDCDPRNAAIHPAAEEIADDGIDQDCSGADTVTCSVDGDGDGAGSSTLTLAEGNCTGAGVSNTSGDCDDTNSSIFPGAPEIPDDGIDQDCNGTDTTTCYFDADGDSFGSVASWHEVWDCAEEGLVSVGGDCDDTNPGIHPSVEEIPDDGIDQNCSGTDTVACYFDADGDGHGAGEVILDDGGVCRDGMTTKPGDCDDEAPEVFPGAFDVPGDTVDQNCDGADAEPTPMVVPGTGGAGGNPRGPGGSAGAPSAQPDAEDQRTPSGAESAGCACQAAPRGSRSATLWPVSVGVALAFARRRRSAIH